MTERWIVNVCPFLHFDNARTQDYEHNVSIASWNIKSALDFLDIDPSHKFCVSQVTLLEGFKRLFPNYWDSLHEHVLDGRIEVVGGTYVMPDLILPDGESIVRQFLLGTRWIREELGVDVKTGWAIDSAGHCAQMPQVLRQCGIDSYFFWRGQQHDAPTEFIWKGPDGSRVNAVWLSTGFEAAAWLSENTREAFATLLHLVNECGRRATSTNLFIPVGGELVPPPPHLDGIVRQWNETFPDMHAVVVVPNEFATKQRAVQANMPVISGELASGRFAPVRSGGLSSRVRLKLANRRLEGLLYLLEIYQALAGIHDMTDDVDNLWRILLFNQDHNIIRGTCGDGAYTLAMRRYEKAIAGAEDMLETAIDGLSAHVGCQDGHPGIVVFNPLPWARSDVARVAVDTTVIGGASFSIRAPDGTAVPYQVVGEDTESGQVEVVFIATDVPSLGYRTYAVVPSEAPPDTAGPIRTGDNWVETEDYSLEFDRFSGAITRLFDKETQSELFRREAMYITMENEAGDTYRHAESPLTSEASVLTSLRTAGKTTVVESGPVRAVVEVTGKIGSSQRTHRVTVYNGLRRIDFEVGLDLRDARKRVRLNFELNVFTDEVGTGAQFMVQRRHVPPTDTCGNDPGPGTFPALDWVDCVGPDKGVCIIAVGLREFEYRDGRLSVTLVRSVSDLSHGLDDEVQPAPLALDLGQHSFRGAIFPHRVADSTEAWMAAAECRLPLLCYPLDKDHGGGPLPTEATLFSVEGVQLALSSYRPAPVPDEYVVRLYEPVGASGRTRVSFYRDVESATLLDLRERVIGELPHDRRTVTIPVDPYSIVTLRVKLAPLPVREQAAASPGPHASSTPADHDPSEE